jgi:hypothetical protein
VRSEVQTQRVETSQCSLVIETGGLSNSGELFFGTSLAPATKKHLTITKGVRQVLDLPTDCGRREWTRTIDPHHVKVVL